METFLQILKALESVAIIVASCTAVLGINAWRREHIGRKKLDLAEETLLLFYQARDVIRYMRNPIGRVEEGETRKKDSKESEKQTKARNEAHVPFERFDSSKETFNRLQALRYRFIIYFNEEHGKNFDEIRKIVHEIFYAARRLAEIWEYDFDRLSPDRRTMLDTERKKHEGIFWDEGEDDAINKRLNNAIQAIETVCKAEIKKATAA
ncbi:MAG: hypothetical protein HY804_04720 [Nitrospinae bacterium]|nr:hypothetical protein [Nitrospinota bacterium]